MGAEYKVHTKLLTEFETLGVMGENCSGIIMWYTKVKEIGHHEPIGTLHYNTVYLFCWLSIWDVG